MATDCFESPCSVRGIPGNRAAGIFTTGTFQELVKLHHQKPRKRALVIGSECIALSNVITLRNAGLSIAGIVEAVEVG